MRDFKPNPVMVKRACYLWGEIVKAPTYKMTHAGSSKGENLTEMFSSGLNSMLQKPVTEAQIKIFKKKLFTTLTTKNERGRYESSLHVDYGPDEILFNAIELAKISKSNLSIKTNMHVNTDCVMVSEGYGAPYIYHYQMPSGRWLVTSLNGLKEEIESLFNFPEFFRIEEDKD